MSGVLKELIKKPIFLAVTSTCPYCKNAIGLANQKGFRPDVLVLDKNEDGADLRKTLTEMTSQRTVPYVFANGKFVGGFSELAKQPETFWTKLQK